MLQKAYIGAVALLSVAAVIVCSPAVASEGAFTKFTVDGQARGVAVSPSGEYVFLALYDTNELLCVDARTGQALAAVPVGQGPAALAVSSDGTRVACVNRLDSSLSLIRFAGGGQGALMSVMATTPCGEGAWDVAALADGRFVVTESFADRGAVVDSENGQVAATFDVPGVPNAVAASKSHLAVAARVPPSLHLFKPGTQGASNVVSLPSTPECLVALDDNTFAVGTKGALLVVDAASGAIVSQKNHPASDLAVWEKRLYALNRDAVAVYDATLRALDTLSLDEPGQGLAAAGGFLVVASPKAKVWQIAAVASPTLEAKRAEPELAWIDPKPEVVVELEEPTPEPVVEHEPGAIPEPVETRGEPTPVEEAEKAEAPAVAEAEPVVEEPSGPQKPEESFEATVGEPEETEVEPADASKEAPPPEDIKPTSRTFEHRPRGRGETRAPSTVARPSPERPEAVPIGKPGKRSVSRALAEGFDLSAPGAGFEAPSETDRLRNVRAKKMQWKNDGAVLIAEGDVKYTLDNTRFSAERFYYDRTTGEMHASGDVEMIQQYSTLYADDVDYTIPVGAELQTPSLTGEGVDPFRQGRLVAENVLALQPLREFRAGHIDYDFASESGEIENVQGRMDVFYFGAERIRILGPADAEGDEVWVTTCNRDPPHYRVRVKKAIFKEGQAVVGKNANLKFGKMATPVWWPQWGLRTDRPGLSLDFDTGKRGEIGYYVNVGQRFALNPDVDLGFRFFPTSRQGIGFGIDSEYDFTLTPASPLFLGEGEFHTLYTTKDRGYAELYHRHEVLDNTLLLLQTELWSDDDFYKDFFYEQFRNRTEPRTFANVTYTKPDYIATGTVRKTTHGFVAETERLPEATFHLLERELVDRLYFTFDTVAGYNEREPAGTSATRWVNVARLSYDLELDEALNLTPFWELEGTWYSDKTDSDGSDLRLSNTLGATLQTRFHRSYPGVLGFSGFKHVLVPSITYSYRPDPSMNIEDTPRFDAYDNVYGRDRIESKFDNIVFGRDAETAEVWQVGRLTLYHGTDFWNELRKSEDYEAEVDVRPRPWWGLYVIGEHHRISGDYDIDDPFYLEQTALRLYERVTDEPYDPELGYRYNAQYGDYDRILSYLYYDDTTADTFGGRLNGRMGFAYTKTQDRVFNREVLYGLGYRLNENWSLAFEHRYDLERDDVYRQEYEIRRNLHCWEGALLLRDRASGWDIAVEFTLTAFPATKVKF